MIFLFISSSSDFGTYKCKAENRVRNKIQYSRGFNFTLAGMHGEKFATVDEQNVVTMQLFQPEKSSST